jgi:transposase
VTNNREADIATARRMRAVGGMSKRQIAEIFEVSTGTLTTWLRGVDPPAWTHRPNAKDDLRERARDLRLQAYSVPELADELGVSKSTAYLWVRDIPKDQIDQWQARHEHAKVMAEARWAEYREERDARHASIAETAAASVPALTDEEIMRLGALIYWCEGSKQKPWGNSQGVVFVNSDSCLIKFFLAFLRAAGVEREQVQFRVQIHESADAGAAVDWWARIVGAEPSEFQRTTLKRHNPKTIRHNTGAAYHGCLVIRVRKSRELYWKIEGWVAGLTAAVGPMG